MKLLVISSDPATADWLLPRLQEQGFIPQLASSPNAALREDIGSNALAILLDSYAANGSAQAAVESLRRGGLHQPLVIIKDHRDWREATACLDAGADDFVAKPVRSEEIASRLRAAIRRGVGESSDRLVFGAIKLDLKLQCAWLADTCLELTRNEFRLLRLFSLSHDRMLAQREIFSQLYPGRSDFNPNAVEVLVARLRRKIGREGIVTVRGSGYRFVPDQAASTTPASSCEPCKSSRRDANEVEDPVRNDRATIEIIPMRSACTCR